MATPVNRLGCFALRYSSRIPLRRRHIPSIARFRNLHTTSTRRVDVREDEDAHKDAHKDALKDALKDAPKEYVFELSSLSPAERNMYDYLSPEEKLEYEKDSRKFHEHMNSPSVQSELTAEASTAAFEVSQEIDPEDFRFPKIKTGLMAMGEEDEQGSGEDEEFQGDDITSLAHGELEQHREMREYARIAAWEMPLLSKFAKRFRPPRFYQRLRFRYTTYMGESHPAEKKIVVEFCTSDLRILTDKQGFLTEKQRIKLIKLVGPRYNPETDIVKMSCEMFETQAQNKRYLGDLVNTLVDEAKNDSDMFEDVPLDFRHHRYKRKVVFPESWKMTPENKEELEAKRNQELLSEQERELKGQVVDGVQVIESWLKQATLNEPKPMLVEGRGRTSSRGGLRKQKLRR